VPLKLGEEQRFRVFGYEVLKILLGTQRRGITKRFTVFILLAEL
jgi:hypothetical protein